MLVEFIPQLTTVAVIAIFMAISPGADFVMITRNSIFYNRKTGLFSALGISIAIWLHVAYSVAGLAVIISSSVLLFSIIKYCGAAYLIYMGYKTLRANTDLDIGHSQGSMSAKSAFRIGFITNALNPKTTVFFLSIFTQVVDSETPILMQILFGAIISLAHLAWFSCVAIFLTQPRLLSAFKQGKNVIEKVVGGVLVAFGLKIAVQTG
ncbi:LysE family translocator [Alteromonas sp. ASW11-130]|uniref:LysE family translocator n=1 Tax=Alteromonas sp. ASW11-130 TaxID=3015775 RepID=UPI002241B64B|nr:LysE family transporter [Alteromonas sp. ASW11-130]MCW8091484.1 LysE family transporter [Alteromonas sp. ASW11-130]